mmetsp:Transcript_6781/g.27721  ORF Transcript_6781/g.27721 Transcript_6781/m.27721 type:complete len:330 (-) Transcript_6781:180-1169(-)
MRRADPSPRRLSAPPLRLSPAPSPALAAPGAHMHSAPSSPAVYSSPSAERARPRTTVVCESSPPDSSVVAAASAAAPHASPARAGSAETGKSATLPSALPAVKHRPPPGALWHPTRYTSSSATHAAGKRRAATSLRASSSAATMLPCRQSHTCRVSTCVVSHRAPASPACRSQKPMRATELLVLSTDCSASSSSVALCSTSNTHARPSVPALTSAPAPANSSAVIGSPCDSSKAPTRFPVRESKSDSTPFELPTTTRCPPAPALVATAVASVPGATRRVNVAEHERVSQATAEPSADAVSAAVGDAQHRSFSAAVCPSSPPTYARSPAA